MKKIEFNALHKDTQAVVVKAVIVAVVFLVVGYVFLYPVYAQAKKLDKSIDKAREDLLRAQIYQPVYERLAKLIEQGKHDLLPLPKSEPLPMNQVESLSQVMKNMGAEAGLEPLDVIISPSSLRENSGGLMMQCVYSGDSAAFERYFMALNEYPHLARVDRLEMQAVPGGLEIFVQLWVAMEGGEKPAPAPAPAPAKPAPAAEGQGQP